MSQEYSDRLRIGEKVFRIDARPLTQAFVLYDLPLFEPIWPVSSRGYVGYWTLLNDRLVLETIWPPETRTPAALFPKVEGPVVARWYSGIIRGRGGERRYTGAPAREFYDDEIVMEIVEGVVKRLWRLDLRGVPDQTDDEIRLTSPSFLWPERLR